MKNFDTVLEDNNIYQPRTAFGKKFHEKRWADVREAYERLRTCYNSRVAQWAEYQKNLEESWQRDFPVVLPEPQLTFSTHAQALKAIHVANEKLRNIHLMDHFSELDKAARKEWVDSLVAQAGEDCDLLVIKGSYTPYDFNKERFDNSVKEHSPSSISIMCISPIWVAFNPHKEYDTTYWSMSRSSSTVEYIKK